jgi:hypothetical protein
MALLLAVLFYDTGLTDALALPLGLIQDQDQQRSFDSV